MDVGTGGTEADPLAAAADPDADLAALTERLESADDLPLDERLSLLRDAEASIARSLEGLDGL